MAVKMAVLTRNARLDAIETEVGTAPILKLRTGAAPADCGTADSGTVLCSMTLPSDWMQAAGSGQMVKSAAAWTGTASGGGGTIEHFRLYVGPGGTVCKMQGTVGLGTGDLSLDNNVVADGQTVTVTAFTLTDGNA